MDDWTLTPEQFKWMKENAEDVIYAWDNQYLNYYRHFVEGNLYKSLFGEMHFNEAYDRYETMLENSGSDEA